MPLGLMEISLIALFVLLVFGAKRIPELARALGQAANELKKAKSAQTSQSRELLNTAKNAELEHKIPTKNS